MLSENSHCYFPPMNQIITNIKTTLSGIMKAKHEEKPWTSVLPSISLCPKWHPWGRQILAPGDSHVSQRYDILHWSQQNGKLLLKARCILVLHRGCADSKRVEHQAIPANSKVWNKNTYIIKTVVVKIHFFFNFPSWLKHGRLKRIFDLFLFFRT